MDRQAAKNKMRRIRLAAPLFDVDSDEFCKLEQRSFEIEKEIGEKELCQIVRELIAEMKIRKED